MTWQEAAKDLRIERTLHPMMVRAGFFNSVEREKPGTMMAAYQWEEAPIGLRDREVVLLFYRQTEGQMDQLVGWASLIAASQDQGCQELVLGVLPEWRGHGYRRAILMLASDWAFEHNGAEACTAVVLNTNKDQQRAYQKDYMNGFPFQWAGLVWHPEPGYVLYTREKPEAEEDDEPEQLELPFPSNPHSDGWCEQQAA